MNLLAVFVLIPGACLVLLPRSGAQALPPDTAFSRQAMAAAEQLYKKEIAENLHLYNGTEYLPRGHGVKGFPFFQWPGLVSGSVFYDGNLYTAVGMQYDLEEDNLIINDYSGNYFIRLLKDKVGYFIISGHRFVHLLSGEGLPASGFYESLYNGKINAYARRQKKMALSVNASDNDASYLTVNAWFIEKGDKFFPVSGEHSMLAVLNDKKDLLKKYIRSTKLVFKKDPETFIARVSAYYTQLNN